MPKVRFPVVYRKLNNIYFHIVIEKLNIFIGVCEFNNNEIRKNSIKKLTDLKYVYIKQKKYIINTF